MRWRLFTAGFVLVFVGMLAGACMTIVALGEARDRREAEQCLRRYGVCYKEGGHWQPWYPEEGL